MNWDLPEEWNFTHVKQPQQQKRKAADTDAKQVSNPPAKKPKTSGDASAAPRPSGKAFVDSDTPAADSGPKGGKKNGRARKKARDKKQQQQRKQSKKTAMQE
jgi:hypothetical protein